MVFEFATEAAAKGFIEGIKYVNDSSIEIIDIRRVLSEGTWWVEIEDGDNGSNCHKFNF